MMIKPRVIIADTDLNYIIPLQLKFVEDFFEKVDLEIVTEQRIFSELFSVPQRADILIVSEELYEQSVQRHNISNIFLMTEQYKEEQTADLNVNLIFKYTSVREIFNEIISKAADVLNVDISAKKNPQIILVYSACGGVGKTTIAMGISACMARNYKRVLYMNAGYLQSFQRLLNNETPISSSDVYAILNNETEQIYNDIKHVIRKEQFNYIPPFKAALMSLELNYSIYNNIALCAKKSGDFDYIVIDADSSFNEEKAELFEIADKVIIVTEQSASSVYATNLLVSNVNGMSGEKYIFVCNNFDKDEDNALISPTMTMKFTVSEYVEHIRCYDQVKCADLVEVKGIQKITFLLM